jgi:hypothetical protein
MIRDVIVIVSPMCVVVGTVLRMWDALAEADRAGEFVARTSSEELRRFFRFFTPLERFEHAATKDREQYYLRTAQGWFFLCVGATGALVLAIASVIDI